MEFKVEIAGLDSLKKSGLAVNKAVFDAVRAGLYLSGKRVEEAAKRSVAQGPKTGQVYKRKGVEHRASAPGEAPASDTGRLLNSIHLDGGRVKQEGTALVAEVKAGDAGVKYAAHLEFGTHEMEARPFMHPALESNKPWIGARIEKAVRDGIARGAKK